MLPNLRSTSKSLICTNDLAQNASHSRFCATFPPQPGRNGGLRCGHIKETAYVLDIVNLCGKLLEYIRMCTGIQHQECQFRIVLFP